MISSYIHPSIHFLTPLIQVVGVLEPIPAVPASGRFSAGPSLYINPEMHIFAYFCIFLPDVISETNNIRIVHVESKRMIV